MDELETFYEKIPEENKKSLGTLIPYFAFYCTQNKSFFVSSEIGECFDKLQLKQYSNISSYLSSKAKGKNSLFIHDKKNGYILSREWRQQILKELSDNVIVPIDTNFFDIGLLDNTRDNYKKIAIEMCQCYQVGAYTASCVMMRRLIETYIIECFESHGYQDEIKDQSTGDYLFLSELIPKYLGSKKWPKSKNIKTHLLEIKKLGDQSAHNRFFFARKSDLDNVKSALRQAIQEIIQIIDYPSWNERIRQKK